MSLSITFLGQSGFRLSDGTHAIVIDPFLSGNPVAKHKPGDITCDYVALTHGHQDHFGDTIELAKANNATVIGSFEICNYVNEKGIEKIEPGNVGGTIKTSFGWVAFTQAFHSSSFQGVYMGMPMGLMINIDGRTFYHTGDTGLFSDMKLLSEIYKPEIAAIPVGDRFTMDGALATRAAEFIKPKVAIPIHYKTMDLLAQDASAFRPSGITVKELQPGETWEYSG